MQMTKASIITVVLVLLFFSGFYFLISKTGVAYKASEAQGLFYFSLMAITVFVSVIAAFPLAYHFSRKENIFSRRKWTYIVFSFMAVLSFLISLLAHVLYIGGKSIGSVATLWIMVFFISILLLAPLAWLWLWFVNERA